MILEHAIDFLAEWKAKFRAAIAAKGKVDVPTVVKRNCCELGEWLDGDGVVQCGSLPIYHQCVARHADFHREAGRVVAAINAGKHLEAAAMIQANSAYADASARVAVAVGQLRKECP